MTMAKLPILMYHHISTDTSSGLTTGISQLEAQFSWIRDQGFTTWHLSELEERTHFPKGKHMVITFDDAYVSFKELALPLLQKYKLKATLFVPLGFLGKTDAWNSGKLPIMNVDDLRALDPSIVELGYHSFEHPKYHEISLDEVKTDMQKCYDLASNSGLLFSKALAYPYGKYPREKEAKKEFVRLLEKSGLHFGLRIGNRVNSFPFSKPFEIQRLDIKGEFSLAKFSRKVKYGKLL